MLATLLLCLLTTAAGQLFNGACPNPSPVGNVANFQGAFCDDNGKNIAQMVMPNVSACAKQCMAMSNCIAFAYWYDSGPDCWLKSSAYASGVYAVNSAGHVLYLRQSCNVTSPANGNASYVGGQSDGSPCFVGVCYVTWTCQAGYVLNGSAISNCVANGSQAVVLSPPAPTCVAVAGAVSPHVPLYPQANCGHPAPAGYVPNFIDGWCDCWPCSNIVSYAAPNLIATNAQTCGQQCLNVSNCTGFAFWYESGPTCFLKLQMFSAWVSAFTVNVTGYSLYLRASCNVIAPANGNASYVGYADADGSSCFVGICNVTFTCKALYVMNGSAKSNCMGDGTSVGTLSPPVPACNLAYCSALAAPKNGTITGGAAAQNPLTATATYACDACFTLQGSAKTVCIQPGANMEGVWNTSAPVCLPIKCSNIFNTATGTIAPAPYYFSTTYTFTCNADYALAPAATTSKNYTCNCTGQWDSAFVACIPMCPLTFTSTIQPIVAGVAIEGNTVMFSCPAGSTLFGSSSLLCQYNGTWNGGPLPTCIANCPNIFDNTGTVNASTFIAGTTYTFVCNANSEVPPSTITTEYNCSDAGQWLQPFVSCVPFCNVSQPINGLSSYNESSECFVDQCNVTSECDAGYILNGSALSSCIGSGAQAAALSPPLPTCEAGYCSALQAPGNGTVTGGSLAENAFGTVAMFACDACFTLLGNTTATCVQSTPNLELSWNATAPVCLPLQCSNMFNTATGTIVGGAYIANANYTFTCNAGYAYSATMKNMSYACSCAGTWNTGFTPCTAWCAFDFVGPVLPTLIAGVSWPGNTVTFGCPTGYQLQGASSVECGTGGAWSGPLPTCVSVNCPNIFDNTGTASALTFAAGNSYTFTCGANFVTPGDALSTVYECGEGGQWMQQFVSCVVTCQSLPSISNGNIAASENVSVTLDGRAFVGTTATVTCNQNYNLSGQAHVTCTAKGQWSSNFPTCTGCGSFIQCNWPLLVSLATVMIVGLALSMCPFFLCAEKRKTKVVASTNTDEAY